MIFASFVTSFLLLTGTWSIYSWALTMFYIFESSAHVKNVHLTVLDHLQFDLLVSAVGSETNGVQASEKP